MLAQCLYFLSSPSAKHRIRSSLWATHLRTFSSTASPKFHLILLTVTLHRGNHWGRDPLGTWPFWARRKRITARDFTDRSAWGEEFTTSFVEEGRNPSNQSATTGTLGSDAALGCGSACCWRSRLVCKWQAFEPFLPEFPPGQPCCFAAESWLGLDPRPFCRPLTCPSFAAAFTTRY